MTTLTDVRRGRLWSIEYDEAAQCMRVRFRMTKTGQDGTEREYQAETYLHEHVTADQHAALLADPTLETLTELRLVVAGGLA